MKTVILAAVLAATTFSALPALAQQVGAASAQPRLSPQMQEAIRQRMQDRLRETDTNGDGAVSHEEFIAQAEARFKTADLNGDGKITPDEFAQLRQKMIQQALQQRNAAAGGK